VSGVLRHLLSWLCLILGVVGLVLPILQGWLFLALGAVLLDPDLPIFARLVCWIERRFPRVRRLLQKLRRRLGRSAPPPCKPDTPE